MRRPHWRFDDLDIWNRAVELAVKFHRIADRLDELLWDCDEASRKITNFSRRYSVFTPALRFALGALPVSPIHHRHRPFGISRARDGFLW